MTQSKNEEALRRAYWSGWALPNIEELRRRLKAVRAELEFIERELLYAKPEGRKQ